MNMCITPYSFVMGCIWTSILTIIMRAIQKSKWTLQYFGVNNLLILYAFCIFRMTIPIEFSATKVVPVEAVYNAVTYLCTKIKIGGTIPAGYLFLIIWFCGTVIKLFLRIRDYRISKQLLFLCTVIREGAACELLEKLQNEKGDKRKIQIYRTPFDMPMEMGILHPVILLPDQEYDGQSLYYIMKHEYTHILNRDAAVKLLLNLWSCIFWWNPTAYLLNLNIENILELKCDLKVTQGLKNEEKADYLSSILQMIQGTVKKEEKASSAKNDTSLYKKYVGENLKKRFLCVSKCPETTGKASVKYKTYMATMIMVYIILFFASYSVVFQSKFDVPVEEVMTEDNVYFLEPEAVILRQTEGGYEVIYKNECVSVVDENIAQLMLEEGFEFK